METTASGTGGSGLRRAVFLDRDGTLIEDRDYLSRPEEVVWFPQTMPALQRLTEAGFLLVLVTNQSGVGRGFFSLSDVERVHAAMKESLRAAGVDLARIFVAPEHPDQPSRGRKPSPQFFFDARDELQVRLDRSYMVGDKLIDLEAGWNAGLRRSLLVRTGYGAATERKAELGMAVVVSDLGEAADWILRDAI